jgi:acyl-CoA synthetase (AMP-forming)/AMP-acid ligase II
MNKRNIENIFEPALTQRGIERPDPGLDPQIVEGGLGNPSSLVELLRWRAANQREQAAFIYLLNGDEQEACLTYGELDFQARTIATALRTSYQSGERALLLYPPGLEFIKAFFGCLYAGVIPIPAYPPHPARLNRTLPKLQAIALDAEPAVVLTDAKLLAGTSNLFQESPLFRRKRWLATDRLVTEVLPESPAIAIRGDALAFLQYTSGSTAMPKGVMVTHQNLLHNSAYLAHAFHHTPESILVTWLPTFHDMGLIYGILQPIYSGFRCYIMPPASFVQRPLRWLQAMSRYRATHSVAPNFAYDLCARKITVEQRAVLDLQHWRVAVNGAEPIRIETLERFARAFACCGFRRSALYPGYGLAEATLKVTGGRKTEEYVTCRVAVTALAQHRVVEVEAGDENQSSQRLVSSGRAMDGVEVVTVNPETLVECPPECVGEIWVRGPSNAQGYWNRIEDTRQIFHAHLSNTGDGPYLRTGDLGFLKDGELFVTGRRKDLIIIGGSNYYPQDIELTVERSHTDLRPGSCAAFAIDEGGAECLVVVIEVERHHRRDDKNGSAAPRRQPVSAAAAKDIVMAIQHAVAEEHELQIHQVVLLKAGSISKTSSGKIQRHVCKEAFLASGLDRWVEQTRRSGEAGLDRDRLPGSKIEEESCTKVKV